MKPEKVERLGDERNFGDSHNAGPVEPVTDQLPGSTIGRSHGLYHLPAQDHGTGIGNDVGQRHEAGNERAPLPHEVVGPEGSVEVREVFRIPLHGIPVLVHMPGVAIGQANCLIGFELAYELLKQVQVGIVVAFSNPDILAVREANALIPLLEGAAAIFGVECRANAGVFSHVAGNNLPATIWRAVIQNEYFQIRISLVENAFNALRQIVGVVIIRNYNRNQWATGGCGKWGRHRVIQQVRKRQK